MLDFKFQLKLYLVFLSFFIIIIFSKSLQPVNFLETKYIMMMTSLELFCRATVLQVTSVWEVYATKRAKGAMTESLDDR